MSALAAGSSVNALRVARGLGVRGSSSGCGSSAGWAAGLACGGPASAFDVSNAVDVSEALDAQPSSGRARLRISPLS